MIFGELDAPPTSLYELLFSNILYIIVTIKNDFGFKAVIKNHNIY